MAGASLAAAASLPPEAVLDQNTADTAGDRSIARTIQDRSPGLVAFTLYMWNAERSAWLAKALKKRIPGIITVAGGPEVSGDNDWLVSSGAFDLMVSGEGETYAEGIMDPVSADYLIRQNGSLLTTGSMRFLPGSYPNPWLSGYLDPSGVESVFVETIRGCAGACSYCSYRRTHSSPRILSAQSAAELLGNLIDAGAGEIVFLDPTFNSRTDLADLLKEMNGLECRFFGEMRGDLISPKTASLIADAGFKSVEIGLQSINIDTLIRSGRSGNPLKVLEGATHLKNAGVTPILDIMLGLPGDTPEDAVRAARMIKDRNLHQHVQAFYVSMLPGTSMREELSGLHMSRPPYFSLSKDRMTGFAEAREEIADIVGYDLDLAGRPVLLKDWPGTECIDLGLNPPLQREMPSFRHGVIRIASEDLWVDRDLVLAFVRTRLEADPFCVLDVILCPKREFPLNLIDLIIGLDTPLDYSGRTARVMGRQGNLRVTVLIEESEKFSSDWIVSVASSCTAAVNTDCPEGLRKGYWEAGVCAVLPGSNWDLDELSTTVPSLHQVLFTDKQMEVSWSRALDL